MSESVVEAGIMYHHCDGLLFTILWFDLKVTSRSDVGAISFSTIMFNVVMWPKADGGDVSTEMSHLHRTDDEVRIGQKVEQRFPSTQSNSSKRNLSYIVISARDKAAFVFTKKFTDLHSPRSFTHFSHHHTFIIPPQTPSSLLLCWFILNFYSLALKNAAQRRYINS